VPVGLVVASSRSRVKLDPSRLDKPLPSSYDTNNQSFVSRIGYHKSLPIPQASVVAEDSEPGGLQKSTRANGPRCPSQAFFSRSFPGLALLGKGAGNAAAA
jgi:hypothetical protein